MADVPPRLRQDGAKRRGAQSSADAQLDVRTRGEIWSSAATGIDGTVYVGSLDNRIYAIGANGAFKWDPTKLSVR